MRARQWPITASDVPYIGEELITPPPRSKKVCSDLQPLVAQRLVVADVEGDPGAHADHRHLLAGRGDRLRQDRPGRGAGDARPESGRRAEHGPGRRAGSPPDWFAACPFPKVRPRDGNASSKPRDIEGTEPTFRAMHGSRRDGPGGSRLITGASLRPDADVDRAGQDGRAVARRRARGPWGPARPGSHLARRASGPAQPSTISAIGLLVDQPVPQFLAGPELHASR